MLLSHVESQPTCRLENQVLVCQLFEAQVERSPDAIAIEHRGQCWTYQELNTRVNHLAHYLCQQGLVSGDLVGLYVDRSFDMIVGLLAVLKAGGAYVPLDPAYPADRLDWMLADSQVTIVLTHQRWITHLSQSQVTPIGLDTDWPIIAQASSANPPSLTKLDGPAYVIYTSGSTGKPKGVIVGHNALANFVQAANQIYRVGSTDRMLQFASISFDAAIEEIFVSLTQGATLVLRTSEMLQSVSSFLQACEDLRLTVLDLPTAFWHQLCATLTPANFPDTIRLTIIGGERALPHWLDRWKQCVNSRVRLINTYGPTESTVVATCCELAGPQPVNLEGDRIPIGQPLLNIQAFVLDSSQQLVSPGEPGELYLSGQSLAQGYLNRPELTADRFRKGCLPDNPGLRLYRTGDLVRYRQDGLLEFLGRADHQVKINGFRVELREIEATLEQHSTVQEAVVLAQTDLYGGKRLLAYVQARNSTSWEGMKWYETQLEKEQIQQWQVIHNDDHLNSVNTDWDNTFNISGWISSYTGEQIPEVEMQEWVGHTVDRILQLQPRRVLELGCGTGLLLFQIAPHCQSYVGTDISEASLAYIQAHIGQLSLPHVTLQHKPADDFEGIEPASYDTVILNSVLQYFPSVDYLMRVLELAVQRIQPGGKLFIGDVRNYLLQEAFATAVELHRAADNLPIAELQNRIQKRLHQEEELTVDPSFFLALQQRLPQISQVQILLKHSQFQNELTQFRYDVVLHIDSFPQVAVTTTWFDWQQQGCNLSRVRQWLLHSPAAALGIRGIPNARVLQPVSAVAWLKQACLSGNVGDLRQQLTRADSLNGIDPADLRQLAHELSYDIVISWAGTDQSGRFNALFQRQADDSSQKRATLESIPPEVKSPPKRPWHTFANNPLQAKQTQTLASQLRDYLAQHLPRYMVPAAVVVMDSFPLTPNGKIDRQTLPVTNSSRPALTTPCLAPSTDLEEELATIWSTVLGVAQIGVKDSFFELGGDSLRLMQLMTQLEKSFQTTFSVTDFFNQPTIAHLAEQLQVPAGFTTSGATEFMTIPQLQREARLNCEISPDLLQDNQTKDHWTAPEAILLTGATGFIGASLLYELLRQTKAKIYCLLRASTPTQAYQKLRQVFESYLPNVPIPYTRIIPIMGDLAKPLLGITVQQFKELAGTVDTIYHSAASVNLFYPYGALKAVNVMGTRSILKLASQSKLKPIHFISTLDVFESLVTTGVSVVYEQDSIAQGNGLAGGYAQSKWVAEHLVTQASTTGIPVCIYRPGMVTGHSQTGICNPSDLMSRFLRSLIQLKLAPDLNWMIDMTPVDYVSQAIVHLSRQPTSLGQSFHLVNSTPLSLTQLITDLKSLGQVVEPVQYSQWQTKLKNSQNALSPLINVITEALSGQSLTRLEIWLAGMQLFDCENTTRGLRNTKLTCPTVDRDLLSKYLNHLTQPTPVKAASVA
jgi:amino acid adenylation domain-containing protein/thioester reductase-like protein